MLSRGGTDGNERLTVVTGVILFGLLAIIGVTILRIHQLMSVHLFVGLLLIGPVALKLASTGYRFAQYYTGNPEYRRKGPPELTLRLVAPIVVLTTIVVFASGIVLMFKGAAHRDPWLLIHKASFIVWIVFTSVHVVGHLPRVVTLLRPGTKLPTIEGISPNLIAGWSAEHRRFARLGAHRPRPERAGDCARERARPRDRPRGGSDPGLLILDGASRVLPPRRLSQRLSQRSAVARQPISGRTRRPVILG